jgi:ADP-heptose:LPS heptosyltransferase
LSFGADSFTEPRAFAEMVRGEGSAIYVFGTGKLSRLVCAVLADFGLQIHAFLDNDRQKQGTLHSGLPVHAPDWLLSRRESYAVLIASSFFLDIFCQLDAMGIERAYLFGYTLCLPYRAALRDLRAMRKIPAAAQTVPAPGAPDSPEAPGFPDVQRAPGAPQRILFKLWDGIGDNIAKIGIFKYLSERDPGNEIFYYATCGKATYDFMKKISPNAFLIDKKRWRGDGRYRRAWLGWINAMRFTAAVGFAFPPALRWELFDGLSTNIAREYGAYLRAEWRNGILQPRHVHCVMDSMARELLRVPAGVSLRPEGVLAGYLSGVRPPRGPGARYIAAALYGASWPAHYSSRSLAAVLRHFLRRGYDVVLLGSGAGEARRNAMAAKILGQPAHVFDCTGRLPIFESFPAVARAALFLGVDSGLAHAAHSLGQRAVVLKPGTRLSDMFMHEDEKMIYLTAELPCAGCAYCCAYRAGGKDSRHGACIRRVAPADVIRAMEALLEGAGAAGGAAGGVAAGGAAAGVAAERSRHA